MFRTHLKLILNVQNEYFASEKPQARGNVIVITLTSAEVFAAAKDQFAAQELV
jgi:hypothetical protein